MHTAKRPVSGTSETTADALATGDVDAAHRPGLIQRKAADIEGDAAGRELTRRNRRIAGHKALQAVAASERRTRHVDALGLGRLAPERLGCLVLVDGMTSHGVAS